MPNRLINTLDLTGVKPIPDNMTNWIKRNHGHLSFDKIEKAIGIPQGTLSKVAKGERPLPKKWVEPLREYKDRMGW